jgi:hypothetical protein
LWLACHTAEESAEQVGLSREAIQKETEELVKTSDLKKLPKVAFSEEGYQPPLYNVWTFAKKTNEITTRIHTRSHS